MNDEPRLIRFGDGLSLMYFVIVQFGHSELTPIGHHLGWAGLARHGRAERAHHAWER